MSAQLSTHALNTMLGKPAQNLEIHLYRIGDDKEWLKTVRTNADGRCDEPLLTGAQMQQGGYELVFEVESYFQENGVESPFLKEVVIRFHIADEGQKYHIPLLLSPYSYSTYRGS
jgi:5-hydroxyisourate hydrolase